jgi:hypothetical protein
LQCRIDPTVLVTAPWMEAIMFIIGVVIAFLLIASSAYVIVSAIGVATVGPAAVTSISQPRGLTKRAQFVRSDRNADRDQLRKYFLQGLPDVRERVLP